MTAAEGADFDSVDGAVVLGIYKDVVKKVPKAESTWVTDDVTGKLWDTLTAECAAMVKERPDTVFEMISEVQ